MKFDAKDLLSSLLLLGLLLLFNHNVVFFQKYFALGGAAGVPLVLRYSLGQQIQQGFLPLWIVSPDAGRPVFVDPMVGVFYPFNFFLLFPDTLRVFRNIILGHFYMASWFMYLWIRRLNVRHISALIGAIIFGFSSILVSWHQNLYFLEGCVWLPLILLLFHYAIRRRQIRLALIGGFIMAVQLLSGAITFFLGTFCFLVAWSWFAYRDRVTRKVAGKMIGIGIGVCLGSTLYFLLPLAELMMVGNAAGKSWDFTFTFSGSSDFSIWKVIGFVIAPWQDVGESGMSVLPKEVPGTYVGVMAVFLALCGFVLRRGSALEEEINSLLLVLFLSVVSLFLAVLTPLGQVLEFQTINFFLIFSLACLAGLGFDRLLSVCAEWEKDENRLGAERLKKMLRGLFIGMLLLWGVLLYALLSKDTVHSRFNEAAFNGILRSALFALSLGTVVPLLLYKRLGIRGEEKFFAALVLVLVTWELFQVNDGLLRLRSEDEMTADMARATGQAHQPAAFEVTALSGATLLKTEDTNGAPNIWEYVFQSPQAALAVLRQSYVPGWKVYVNGVRHKVRSVHNGWLGIDVERGQNKVKFVYRPFLFVLGMYLSFAFLTGIGIYLWHPFSLRSFIRAFSLGELQRDED